MPLLPQSSRNRVAFARTNTDYFYRQIFFAATDMSFFTEFYQVPRSPSQARSAGAIKINFDLSRGIPLDQIGALEIGGR
jgi:hypothetical protein